MPEKSSFVYLQLTSLVLSCPPLPFLLFSLGLLAIAVWAGREAWVSFRIVQVSGTVPVSSLGAAPAGLVKVSGIALPPPPKPGWNESSTVWKEEVNKWGISRATKTTRTVGEIRLQRDEGVCWIDVGEAMVVATTSQSEDEFLSDNGWKYSREIRRGDRVFALGTVGPRSAPPAAPGQSGWKLRQTQGVLLLSGAPERQVLVRISLRLLLQGTSALLIAALLLWASRTHLESYPPGDLRAVASFLQALTHTPLQKNPGTLHPGWSALTETGPP